MSFECYAGCEPGPIHYHCPGCSRPVVLPETVCSCGVRFGQEYRIVEDLDECAECGEPLPPSVHGRRLCDVHSRYRVAS